VNVQVATPSTGFVAWQSGVTTLGASYTPSAGAGVYKFQAQLVMNGHTSNWSPISRVTVS
jgi:hypothetical protein